MEEVGEVTAQISQFREMVGDELSSCLRLRFGVGESQPDHRVLEVQEWGVGEGGRCGDRDWERSIHWAGLDRMPKVWTGWRGDRTRGSSGSAGETKEGVRAAALGGWSRERLR